MSDSVPERFEPVPLRLQGPLLVYSRALLEHALDLRRTPPEEPAGEPVYRESLGVFVTLRYRGELRGCLGSITTAEPLIRSIRRRTLDAAFDDRRFSALAARELPGITIEHSVLSRPEAVESTDRICIGRHGVVFEYRRARSVFLPEVALQQGWDLDQTLSALALKAGVARDSWKRPEARFQVFVSQHYQEDLAGGDGICDVDTSGSSRIGDGDRFRADRGGDGTRGGPRNGRGGEFNHGGPQNGWGGEFNHGEKR